MNIIFTSDVIASNTYNKSDESSVTYFERDDTGQWYHCEEWFGGESRDLVRTRVTTNTVPLVVREHWESTCEAQYEDDAVYAELEDDWLDSRSHSGAIDGEDLLCPECHCRHCQCESWEERYVGEWPWDEDK